MVEFRGYTEDPEPPDESDPEFQREMFELYRALGYAPEDLADRESAMEYAEWLTSTATAVSRRRA